MKLDLHAKSPIERIRLFLKLYSLPVFVAIFGIATYCMAYEKAYEYKAVENRSIALVQKPQIAPAIVEKVEVVEEIVPQAKDEILGEYFVDASALNVRSQASTQGKIKAKLYRSDSVEVIAVDGEWAQLENGWVLLKYLSRA